MSIEEEKFAGGVAVVTGAGAGIGMGFARRFGEIGMTVIVTDIALDRAEAVAASIREKGGKAEAMRVDVSRPDELDRLAATIFEKYGEVRVLVNNAGIETMGLTWEIPADRWEATLNINIHGVVHGCRAFVPHMIKAGKEAWIANLASIGSFAIQPTQTAYIMTKHAVQSFTECLYLEMEVAKAPIHVSAVLPGCLRTSIFEAEAGAGEPAAAGKLRETMRNMMQTIGMDLDQGCALFVQKMAENRFWVDSQPDMTEDAIQTRVNFITSGKAPVLSEQGRALLD